METILIIAVTGKYRYLFKIDEDVLLDISLMAVTFGLDGDSWNYWDCDVTDVFDDLSLK